MSDNTDNTGGAEPLKLFVCCFELSRDRDLTDQSVEDEGWSGTFEMLIQAQDVRDAGARCRARLHEIAATPGSLGPVLVYASAFIETTLGDISRGLVVNRQEISDVLFCDYLPKQGDTAAILHFPDDEPVPSDEDGESDDDEIKDDEEQDEQEQRAPIFWAKWKLYWCETDDHDEDWFVVARAEWEAGAFHERMEGYDEEDATVELVCVLPDSAQLDAERENGGWPSDDILLACGAEFMPYAPQDGHDELRQRAGAGGRVVRINGRIYTAGDVVSNAVHRLGGKPDA